MVAHSGTARSFGEMSGHLRADTSKADWSKADWRRWARSRQRLVSEATTAAVVAGLVAFIAEFDRHRTADAMPLCELQCESQCESQPGPLPESAGLILFYRAMPHELSLDGLADGLGWQRFAVTRTPPVGPLTLHPAIGAAGQHQTEQHRYGFPQPTADAFKLVPRHIALALVPGLAFDRLGTRLGHGAGYFDELLAKLPEDCPRVGVTPAKLVFDRLPSEPHDVPMTHLATEDGVVPVIISPD